MATCSVYNRNATSAKPYIHLNISVSMWEITLSIARRNCNEMNEMKTSIAPNSSEGRAQTGTDPEGGAHPPVFCAKFFKKSPKFA